jgi:hypothetical protein
MDFDKPTPFDENDWDAFSGAEGWSAAPGGIKDDPFIMSCGAGVFVADRHGVEFYTAADGKGYKLTMEFPEAGTAYYFLVGLQEMGNDVEDEVALEQVGFVPI